MIEALAIWPVEVEVRQRGRELFGSFRYSSTATMSDRGKTRKERFEPGAFKFALDDPTREINLLSGHTFNAPLASRQRGSLKLEDTPEELQFTAQLPLESEQPTWMIDTVKAVRAGLVGGISPGFRVPPADVVPDAESLEPEPGNPGVFIRVIRAAVLFELSIVTRPAYTGTSIDIRGDAPQPSELLWRLI